MDVDNVNCKIKVSQCTEMEILPIERPLKIKFEISGLEKLIEELHRVFSKDHVNVQEVQQLMAGYKSNPKDWKKFARFDRFRYTRNLVDSGNGAFNMMILCWGAGHASAIHDHADSHCFMKLLSGTLDEVRYSWPDNVQPEVAKVQNKSRMTDDIYKITNLDIKCQSDSENGGDYDEEYISQNMKETGRTRLELNDVCYINDALGLHRVENPSHVDGAVSLHLYSPPFDTCRVFDARTGTASAVKVTFWSMYGKRIQRVIESEGSQ